MERRGYEEGETGDVEGQIKALLAMKDEDIDLSDIPEIADWTNAVRGKFFRPIKKPVTSRLDTDVIAWLRASGTGYQTRVNQTLRRQMLKELAKR